MSTYVDEEVQKKDARMMALLPDELQLKNRKATLKGESKVPNT